MHLTIQKGNVHSGIILNENKVKHNLDSTPSNCNMG